ncbi:hypothetical protein HNV08_06650 [Winogradskyella eckloniae]|uniref:hypothetical protein n=1 Tax=Winogradskyella eckloniae TaxID=1089306 RepID=UPI0015671FEA|nr:hypothetical protein [Winogradskyella eckloniae]NRD19722.1 hypothetical protein [Winogradskyella eckloniae]
MKTKTFILAGCCGGIVNWALSWLSYGLILQSYFPQPKDNFSSLTFVFLGCLTMGFFLSYFYNRWAQISTITTGAKAGAFIGFFLSLSYGLISKAMDPSFTTELLTLRLGTTILVVGVTGAVVGYVNGKVRQS